jgi:preprotein translocase subunit SecA
VSLEDPLYRKFGKRDLAELRAELLEAGHRPGQPIDSPRARRLLEELQRKVDLENRATREDVLRYDLVVHQQREAIYAWRDELLAGAFDGRALAQDLLDDLLERTPEEQADSAADADAVEEEAHELAHSLRAHFHVDFDVPLVAFDRRPALLEQIAALLTEREAEHGAESLRDRGRDITREVIDELWTEHLSELERLEDGVRLAAYAESDPAVEWRRRASARWQETLSEIRSRAVRLWLASDDPAPEGSALRD